MRRRTLAYAALALASLAAIPAAASPRERVEQPESKLVASFEDFELRRYEPRLEATVNVKARNAREASNAGFRILANLIFGANEGREEIAMTSPVGRSQKIDMTAPVGQSRQGDTWTISFTMPRQFTAETLPRPKDTRIMIRQLPARLYAIRSFRGSPSEATIAARETELRAWLDEAGYQVVPGPAIYNRYDPPWIPPIMRRNELWVPVSEAR
jgi:hypothetical protein